MVTVAQSPGPAPHFVEDLLATSADVKLLTLALVRSRAGDGKILLGHKKRGFGAGYFNGFGGKVEPGETIEQATSRELLEESGVTAEEMVHRGILTFVFDDQPRPWEVHVYDVTAYSGEPVETEEMRPIWFACDELPYGKMWADDHLWYPLMLRGAFFQGLFGFKDTHQMVFHHVKELPESMLGMSAQELLPVAASDGV